LGRLLDQTHSSKLLDFLVEIVRRRPVSMTRSVGRKTTSQFFVATAAMEAAAGLGLLMTPTLVIALLLAGPVTNTHIALGRLAGAALLSLGAACWWARTDAGSAASRALVVGMSVYNGAVIAVVLAGSFGSLSRPILWVVTLVHGAMAGWCVSLLRSPKYRGTSEMR
jgi:hypothetical protein